MPLIYRGRTVGSIYNRRTYTGLGVLFGPLFDAEIKEGDQKVVVRFLLSDQDFLYDQSKDECRTDVDHTIY